VLANVRLQPFEVVPELLEGSLMLAKTAGNNDVLRDNIEQFRNHLNCLFDLKSGKPRN